MNECVLRTARGDLAAFLDIPAGACGIILFAHGSGSSRFSSRNRYVARELQQAGLATLLLDLLTLQEEAEDARTGTLRFDIGLLAERVEAAMDWCRANASTTTLRIGLFGASTGAAAALVAAAHRVTSVDAIVSRGGRPDLAGDALPRVRAPTLLVVGARDEHVLELNRAAAAALGAEHELAIVPGAGHLFEEPGALEQVATLARDWFAHKIR